MSTAATTGALTARGALGFADIAGFTEFTQAAGDPAAVALLECFERIVAASLPPGGRIVKSLGDGVLTFVPDAAAALRSAVEQQRRFAEVASAECPLWVRIGVHFGEPIRRGNDLVGHDVNLASRVAAQAFPGEVVATYECVREALAAAPLDGLMVREVGPVFVKGVADAVRLMRVGAGTVPAPKAAGASAPNEGVDHGDL